MTFTPTHIPDNTNTIRSASIGRSEVYQKKKANNQMMERSLYERHDNNPSFQYDFQMDSFLPLDDGLASTQTLICTIFTLYRQLQSFEEKEQKRTQTHGISGSNHSSSFSAFDDFLDLWQHNQITIITEGYISSDQPPLVSSIPSLSSTSNGNSTEYMTTYYYGKMSTEKIGTGPLDRAKFSTVSTRNSTDFHHLSESDFTSNLRLSMINLATPWGQGGWRSEGRVLNKEKGWSKILG